MKKGCVLLFYTLSIFYTCLSQDLSDVYRWSFTGIGGTARSAGLANTVTALGGDAMNATINPAGLGLYRKNDVMITLSTRLGNTSSRYIETASSAARLNFAISNFAYVMPVKQSNRDEEAWQGTVLSFHINQYNNFARRTVFSGFNTFNSICDFYAQEGNRTGVGDNTYFGRLGWNSYLIDSAGTNQLLPAIEGGQVEQSFDRFEAGRMGEYGIGLARNYAEKLFIGVSGNIVGAVYKREIEYTEESGQNASFNYILSRNGGTDGYGLFRSTYTDVLKTTGIGVNARFGILYKPNNVIRLGLHVQTPSAISLEDQYRTTVSSDFSVRIGSPNFTAPSYTDSIQGTYQYNITTPARMCLGGAVFFARRGFITSEVEYVNYLRALISARDNPLREVNRQIRQSFQAVLNFKVAGEVRLDDCHQLRVGFAALTTPLNPKAREYTANNSVQRITGWQPNITAGFGYRKQDFYMDVAAIWNLTEEKYYPYVLVDSPSPLSINRYTMLQIFFTIGGRF
ncbi:MAG: hypothetical protein NZ455_03800 [Bacteroidia bacterium]|nr:hypothetical protein [Bacteroidia bacterium]MDW8346732.1 hypothetical protein [Bacteroidia bacterium]